MQTDLTSTYNDVVRDQGYQQEARATRHNGTLPTAKDDAHHKDIPRTRSHKDMHGMERTPKTKDSSTTKNRSTDEIRRDKDDQMTQKYGRSLQQEPAAANAQSEDQHRRPLKDIFRRRRSQPPAGTKAPEQERSPKIRDTNNFEESRTTYTHASDSRREAPTTTTHPKEEQAVPAAQQSTTDDQNTRRATEVTPHQMGEDA